MRLGIKPRYWVILLRKRLLGVVLLEALPGARADYIDLIRQLFPCLDLSGATVRELDPPGGLRLTLVYIAPLIEYPDLQRIVLDPISLGLPTLSPEGLGRSGCIPAPEARLAWDAATLQDGLLDGMAAIHLDGYPQVLLVGSGRAAKPKDKFGPDSTANLSLIRRHLRSPDLRVDLPTGIRGIRTGVVYLAGTAYPTLVEAARDWAAQLGPRPEKVPWWQAPLTLLRVPQVMQCDSPTAVAEVLRRGYVVVLADHVPFALVGPLTIDQLLSGNKDHILRPSVRRVVLWPRIVAALGVLLLPAWLVAAAAYHHALIPGPFLVAMAATRQNAPLPIEGELAFMWMIGECTLAGAARLGGQQYALLGTIVAVLATIAAMQAGVVGPVTVAVALASKLLLLTVPNPTLSKSLRVWRIFFLLGASMLGMYGLGLLLFVLIVYFAWERPFGHALRRTHLAVTS